MKHLLTIIAMFAAASAVAAPIELSTATNEKKAEIRNALNIDGWNNMINSTSPVWRLAKRLQYEFSSAGPATNARVRFVALGDSVASVPAQEVHSEWGYGGISLNNGDWTPIAGCTDTFDQWSRTIGGRIRTIGTAGYMDYTSQPAPYKGLRVHYLANTGNGSFKVQYQVNKTGAWVDLTTATVSAQGGSQAGGVVNTDNGSTETYSMAIFNLPKADYYNLRIIAVTGPVLISASFIDNGAHSNDNTTNFAHGGGGAVYNFSEGGKSLGSHFSQWNQDVLTRAFQYTNPQVIIYKSANAYNLASYQENWPATAAKIMAAAPNALFVVCGSHPQNSMRELYDGNVLVDNYLKNWAANTEGAIFVDVRQNFPSYKEGFDTSTGNVDDLWSDGIHIYSVGAPGAPDGGGEAWVRALVWHALSPAIEWARMHRPPHLKEKVVPGHYNTFRLYDSMHNYNNSATELSPASEMWFVGPPRKRSGLFVRSDDAQYNGGSQKFDTLFAGFDMAPSIGSTHGPGSLTLYSGAQPMMRFGAHSNFGGVYLGGMIGGGVDGARSVNGMRVFAPSQVYGQKPTFVVEGVSGQTTAALLQIDRDATTSATGANLWRWMRDGTVIYDGTVNDANRMTLAYTEPTSNVTVTTPAKTGTVGVVPAYADQTAATAAGLVAGDNYWNTTTGSLKTILP